MSRQVRRTTPSGASFQPKYNPVLVKYHTHKCAESIEATVSQEIPNLRRQVDVICGAMNFEDEDPANSGNEVPGYLTRGHNWKVRAGEAKDNRNVSR